MSSSRNLVLAQVAAVPDQNVIYPSCKYCYSKVYSHGDGEDLLWKCIKCKAQFPECDVNYRFMIHFMITDDCTFCDVSVFGRSLEEMFGCTAYQFKKYLDQNHEETASLVSTTLEEVFAGRFFLFGFKSQLIERQKDQEEFNMPLSLSTVMRHTFPKQNVPQHKYKGTSSMVAFQMIPTPEPENQTPRPTVLKTLRNKIQEKIKYLGGDVKCSNPEESESVNKPCHEFLRPLLIDSPSFSASYGQKSVLLSCDKDSSSFFEKKNGTTNYESYLQDPSNERSCVLDYVSDYPGYSSYKGLRKSGQYHKSLISYDSSFSDSYSETCHFDSTGSHEDESSRFTASGNSSVQDGGATTENQCALNSTFDDHKSLEIPRSDSTVEDRISDYNADLSSRYLVSLDETFATSSNGSARTCVLEKLSLGVCKNNANVKLLSGKTRVEMKRYTEQDVLEECDYEMFDETFDPTQSQEGMTQENTPADENKIPKDSSECAVKTSDQNVDGNSDLCNPKESCDEFYDHAISFDVGSVSDSDSFLLLACKAQPTQEKSVVASLEVPVPSLRCIPGDNYSTESEERCDILRDTGNKTVERECPKENSKELQRGVGASPCLSTIHLSNNSEENAVENEVSSSSTEVMEEMPYSEDLDVFLNEMFLSEELQFQEEGHSEKKNEVHKGSTSSFSSKSEKGIHVVCDTNKSQRKETENYIIGLNKDLDITKDLESVRENIGEHLHAMVTNIAPISSPPRNNSRISELASSAPESETNIGELDITKSVTQSTTSESDIDNEAVLTAGESTNAVSPLVVSDSAPLTDRDSITQNTTSESDIDKEPELTIDESADAVSSQLVSDSAPSTDLDSITQNTTSESAIDEEPVLTVDESVDAVSSLVVSDSAPSTKVSQEEEKNQLATGMLPMSEELFGSQDFSIQEESSECKQDSSISTEHSTSSCLFSSASELFTSSFSSYHDEDDSPKPEQVSKLKSPEGKTTDSFTYKVPVGNIQTAQRRKSVHFANNLVRSENISKIDKQMRNTPLTSRKPSSRRSCLLVVGTPIAYNMSTSSFVASQCDLFSPSPDVCRIRENAADLTLHSTPKQNSDNITSPCVINKSLDLSVGSDIVPTSAKPVKSFRFKLFKRNSSNDYYQNKHPKIAKKMAVEENKENEIAKGRHLAMKMNFEKCDDVVNDCDTDCDSDASCSYVEPSQDARVLPKKILYSRSKSANTRQLHENQSALPMRNLIAHMSSARDSQKNTEENDEFPSANSLELFSASADLFSDCSSNFDANDSICKTLF